MFLPSKSITLALQTLFLIAASESLLPAQELLWPDPIANHVAPAETLGLTHGPMLGQPDSDAMTVWIRTKEPTEFTIRYATELPLSSESPGVRGATVAPNDNTGTVSLQGLKPCRYPQIMEIIASGFGPVVRLEPTSPVSPSHARL